MIADGRVYVLGRDQITRLHDLNGDGEADFYECLSNAYRDLAGRPRLHLRPATRRGRQLLHRLRQPGAAQHLGRRPARPRSSRPASATRTAWASRPKASSPSPAPKGNGRPASMICEVRPGGFYGYRGPKDGQPPDLPLVYLPRGLDNSSGGQAFVDQRSLGAAQGPDDPLLLRRRHVLPGAPRPGRRPAAGGRRAAARRVPLGRASRAVQPEGRPALRLRHGRLGHLHRRRRQLPARPLHGRPRAVPDRVPRPSERRPRHVHPAARSCRGRGAEEPLRPGWNYRYGPAYGSPELSPRHPGIPGHDPLDDPLRHRPRRRPYALPRDPRPAARQPAPPAPPGRRRPAARPLRHGPQARGPLHRLPRLSADLQDDRRPPDPGRPGPGQEDRPEPVAKADPRRPRRSTSRPART